MFAQYRDDLIGINDVAQQLKVHVSTLHRWCGRGVRGKKLPTCLIGGRRYIKGSDLAEFLSTNQPSESSEADATRNRRAQNLLAGFSVQPTKDRSGQS